MKYLLFLEGVAWLAVAIALDGVTAIAEAFPVQSEWAYRQLDRALRIGARWALENFWEGKHAH